MALQQYIGAATAIVGLLVLVHYRDLAVSSAVKFQMLAKVQRLPGGAGTWRPLDSRSSSPEAAAQERFEPVLDAYLRRHEAAVALLDGPSPWGDPMAAASLRLVVVPPSAKGLGNRLQALVTGFALALLTDRVLFVDDPYGRYFGIFKPTFDCNYTQTRMATMRAAPMYKEDTNKDMEAAFVLEDLNVRYKEAIVVRYNSMDYQLPLLSSNARYRRFLNELAPNFGIIGAPLLRPEPAMAAEAAELYAANVPPGSTVVGTHIRLRKNRNRVPPVRWYADTALAVGLRIAPPERLRFFIAGDVPQVIVDFEAHVTATLRRDWNVTSAAVFVRAQNFTDRESDAQRSPSDVVDMLMLGLCNETVLTYGSSFGYVAAAMGLRPPHFQELLYSERVYPDRAVIFGRRKKLHERVAEDHTFFWKALIAEPCYCAAKRLLTGDYSNSSETHDRLVDAWHSNMNWQQYAQCCTSWHAFQRQTPQRKS